MASKYLLTQRELSNLRNALNVTAENLRSHINTSLSKAHGVELVHGYIDTSGNDLRCYRNSVGTIVSNTDPTKANFLRFVVNGQPYYSPVVNTGLTGQPATHGELAGSANPNAVSPTLTALQLALPSTTVGTSAYLQNLLVEHTRKPSQTAHIALTVSGIPFYDMFGYIVGNYRLKIQIADVTYDVPCDTRIGGPINPVRITSQPVDWYDDAWDIRPGHRANPAPCPITVAGSLPITYLWQINSLSDGTGSWIDMDGPDGTSITIQLGALETLYYGTKTNTLTVATSTNGYFRFRCKVTNPAGTVYTRVVTLNQY